ncbi:MAG: hypothetical protein VX727_02360 [Planctomycetota bacterium]|nr:hypothetical protein [Planctomycetota bacterium]
MKLFRGIWIACCMIVGAIIVATAAGSYFSSVALTVVGAIVGLGIGYLFGRFLKLSDWLLHLG